LLEKLGYTVIRIWECEIKKNKIDEKIKSEIYCNDLYYPPTKLMDMGLWKIGYSDDYENRE